MQPHADTSSIASRWLICELARATAGVSWLVTFVYSLSLLHSSCFYVSGSMFLLSLSFPCLHLSFVLFPLPICFAALFLLLLLHSLSNFLSLLSAVCLLFPTFFLPLSSIYIRLASSFHFFFLPALSFCLSPHSLLFFSF